MSETIGDLQREIAEWADGLIPDRTVHTALSKLMLEELPELISSGASDELEFADVVILVLDMAHLQGIDIEKAVKTKMDINRKRTWKVDEITGLMSHVEIY